MMVRLAGVEPATLGLEVRCSIQLSYRRVLEFSRVTARASSAEGSVMPEIMPVSFRATSWRAAGLTMLRTTVRRKS